MHFPMKTKNIPAIKPKINIQLVIWFFFHSRNSKWRWRESKSLAPKEETLSKQTPTHTLPLRKENGGHPPPPKPFNSSKCGKPLRKMPAPAMFSKFKHGSSAASPIHSALESNPIIQYFEVGKQIASSGPELAWKIHDAYRKSDGKVRFFLDIRGTQLLCRNRNGNLMREYTT